MKLFEIKKHKLKWLFASLLLLVLIPNSLIAKPAENNWAEAVNEMTEVTYQELYKDPRMATYGERVIKKMARCVSEDMAEWGKKFDCLYYQLKADTELLRTYYLIACITENGYDDQYTKRLAGICITTAKKRD